MSHSTGEPTNANNKSWLVKRIAWRLQALAEGDLSERARQRAEELARDADLRVLPPKPTPVGPAAADRTKTGMLPRQGRDRLPPAGTILTREYRGETLQVKVFDHGFEFEGQVYRSLSAVAKVITGAHYNGFLFFKLTEGGAQ